jgi:Protein of unknown function (DUF1302)
MHPRCILALALGLSLSLGLVSATPAGAIDFWDKRVQIHGFYETRLAFGMEDFNRANGIAMYGWLHVLDLEGEFALAPDGWGPFDQVSAFARVEVKYDCVWSHACGLFENVDAFGNHPGNLPDRALNARRQGIAGNQLTLDERPYWYGDRQRLTPGLFYDDHTGQHRARPVVYSYLTVGLFSASTGPDGQLGDMRDIRDGNPFSGLPGDDDAGLYLFDRTHRCKAGNWRRKDTSPRGYQTRELLWSIEGCDIEPLNWKRDVADPFRDFANFGAAGDVNPVLLAIGDADGIPDATALPFRPGSENPAGLKRVGPKWESRGVFLPNYTLRKKMKSGVFDSYDQNFTLNELRWNRGASQDTFKELRELYFDLELFDSRLWVRAGKQTIVWGKTELFRNQDQWNPVDIAVGPLSSLEEARIALWALRGVWSFYEVGPLQDVRLELVTLIDEFEPTDVGRCGEPWVPRLACDKSFGLWSHGEQGNGVAGEIRPADPWNDSSGLEVGARVEFRWERFSFALSDYWGYNDSAYQSLLFQYSRNVDPLSGRPRHTQVQGPCTTGDPTLEPSCLAPGHPLGDVVEIQSINQSLFHWVCAGTVGIAPTVDPAACAFTLFNSQNSPLGAPFSAVFSSIVSGTAAGVARLNVLLGETPFTPGGAAVIQPILLAQFGPGGTNTLFHTTPGSVSPLVPLTYDGAADNPTFMPAERALFATYTTDAQEALWGCGVFYQIACDAEGFDLANAEANGMLQSFPWFGGTYFTSWDTTDPTLPQPGTVDALLQGYGADIPASAKKKFRPGDVTTAPVGTRYEDDNGIDDDGDGRRKDLIILPGARVDAAVVGPIVTALQAGGATVSPYVLASLAQYDIAQDGSTGGRVHPFTGQPWASEMAIASWNFLMVAAGLGAEDGALSREVLDRNNPLALGRCSLRQPQYCSFVSGLASQSRNTSSSVRAGGNGKFGRRNFVWQSVGDLALRYQKRNILGFSTDFAEDRTKSSWGVEFTWVANSLTADNSQYDGLSKVNEYNLTISMDRPTFINFLNANRTFLLNTQIFTSYVGGYRDTMPRDGPWTVLWLANVSTGYFQDRFLVSAIAVWDFNSGSGAFLPTVQYRLTENFSITVGANAFTGRFSGRKMGINQFAAFDEDNLGDTVYYENGVSPVRDLDSFFVRVRYTF